MSDVNYQVTGAKGIRKLSVVFLQYFLNSKISSKQSGFVFLNPVHYLPEFEL